MGKGRWWEGEGELQTKKNGVALEAKREVVADKGKKKHDWAPKGAGGNKKGVAAAWNLKSCSDSVGKKER